MRFRQLSPAQKWSALLAPMAILIVALIFWLFDHRLGQSSFEKSQHYRLRFIGEVNWTTGHKFAEQELGGLSSLVYDPKEDLYWSMSDSKGKNGPIRAFAFKVNLTESAFSIEPQKTMLLKNREGGDFPEKALDPEGILPLPGGGFLMSSEGQLEDVPLIPLQLLHFDQQGRLLGELPLDAKLKPTSDQKLDQGIFHNSGFEGFAFSVDGKKLIMSTETSLMQETSQTQFDKGFLPVRILTYDYEQVFAESKKAWYPQFVEREVIYPLSAHYLPNPIPVAAIKGTTGVSDLLPVAQDVYLVLERTFSFTERDYILQIFLANCKEATDVRELNPVSGHAYVTCKKEEVLNFKDVLPLFSEATRSLDNVEGMAWGPQLSNGHRTLLTISDNNFQSIQRTQVLAFEVLEESQASPQ